MEMEGLAEFATAVESRSLTRQPYTTTTLSHMDALKGSCLGANCPKVWKQTHKGSERRVEEEGPHVG